MSWLKNLISVGLLLAAAGLVLATALSDHSDDYGQVPLPQGGSVHLPEGKTTVYFSVLGDNTDPIRQVGGIVFHVVPVGGGDPLTMTTTDGATSDIAVSRSETIGELGAIAKLDVPSSGDYVVSGGSNLPAGNAFLKFGTNAGTAILHRWKL